MNGALSNPAETRQAGFSLFELIAYLAVAATIGLALVNALQVFNRGAGGDVARLQSMTRLETGLRTITEDLVRVERKTTETPEGRRFLFSGGPEAVLFTRLDGKSPGSSQPTFVRLAAITANGGTKVVRQTAFPPDDRTGIEALTWSEPRLLFDVPFQIRFDYRAPRQAGGEWVGSWRHDDRLPRQIRVSASAPQGGWAPFPPVTVTLAIDAEPACAGLDQPGCTLNTGGILTAAAP